MNKNKDTENDVLNYLVNMNRPYSLQDIANNFQTKHCKSAISKVLDNLVDEKKILEKVYGKSKIYFIDQNQYGEVNHDELKNLSEQIDDKSKILKELEIEVKKKEALLFALEGGLSLVELNSQLENEKNVLEELKIKLKDNEKNEKLNNDKLLEDAKIKHDFVTKESRKRKRIANQILDSILEGYPKPKKALLEDIGIEKI